MSVIINNMAMPQNCNECRMMEIIDREDGTFRYICIAHLNEIVNLKERLDTCPLEEVQEPKRGKWIKRKDAMGKDFYICSNCETEVLWRDVRGVLLRVDMQNANFCPNCGADMMERSEE